jgi:hypothetical protein
MVKKTKLVDDLNSAFKALNTTLEKTKQLSETIAKNLKSASGGNSGTAMNPMSPDVSGSMGFSPQSAIPSGGAVPTGFIQQGTVKPGESTSTGFIQSKDGFRSQVGGRIVSAGTNMLGATIMATYQAISPSDYIENDIARRRAGFYMGIGKEAGATAGGNLIQSMMIKGTATDKMDAARAVGLGNSSGMMTGLANYGTIANSAAMFSNLTPGAGLEGGMQATIALNQAQNVNKLRMIGIQVRNPSTGLMNSAAQVGEQIWSYLTKIKTGGGSITAKDISLSLQPGNSLDGMLNQYFGNDEVLRQGVVAFLYQKAGGGHLGAKSLQDSGALPEVAQSFGKRSSAEYKATNAYTSSGVSGIISGNSNITDIANALAGSINAFGEAVNQFVTYTQTLSTAGNGAGGTMLGSAASNGLNVVFGGIKESIQGKIADAIDGTIDRVMDKMMGGGGGGYADGGGGGGGGFFGGGGGKGDKGGKGGAGARPKGAKWQAGGKGGGGRWVNAKTGKPISGNWLKNISKFGKAGGIASLALGGFALASDVAEGQGWGTKQFSSTLGSTAGGVLGSIAGSFLGPGGTILGGMAGAWLGGQIGGMFGEEGGTGDSSPLMNDLKVPENGEFGNKASFRTQSHRGIDLVAPEGTKVFAVKGGKVEKSGVEGALGNMIRIRHADGTATVYGHLKSQLVGNGQEVAEGSQIGLSGNTGRSFGAHLHVALEDKDGGVSDPTGLVFGGGSPSGSAPGMSSASTYDPGKLFQTSSGSLFAGNNSGTGDSSGSMNSGGGGSSTYYGGVNVTINVPQGSAVNETKLAREVKRILEDEEQLRMAVIR